ncbi:7209_t:CDS:2 [Diversispora eburnea]|uniref:7209_t:CDS:1 n=1 Tax=Diversispora eburnea TaxID=1213867 RepID=A0A9N8YP96_9GLOM|nr:7209_t:CDS:2 [Diversispora eburnea]
MNYNEGFSGRRSRRQSTSDFIWKDPVDISGKEEDLKLGWEERDPEGQEKMEMENESERYEVESVMSRRVENVTEKAAFRSKFLAALELSLHLDTELYDKLILKRGIKDSSDVGPRLETVPVAMMPVSRQNSYSSSRS